MYAETALRDHFILRHEQYYMFTWELFMQKQMAEPLIAEVEGVPVAAVFMIRFAGKAWYVYGMSKQIHREKMPNHLLQWQAILRAKEVGCTCYDFWGAPSVFKESDPLWGVFKFKEGFGGKVVRTVGAWDFALRPTLYRTTTILLPKILDLLRRNARKQLSAASQL
jgi:lipid II:glycine glycyltransferase (peptidoglycan interpeptide bridge formation enzyme)